MTIRLSPCFDSWVFVSESWKSQSSRTCLFPYRPMRYLPAFQCWPELTVTFIAGFQILFASSVGTLVALSASLMAAHSFSTLFSGTPQSPILVITIARNGTSTIPILCCSGESSCKVFWLSLLIGVLKETDWALSGPIYLPRLLGSLAPSNFFFFRYHSVSDTNSSSLASANFSSLATSFLTLICAILLQFLLRNFLMLYLSYSLLKVTSSRFPATVPQFFINSTYILRFQTINSHHWVIFTLLVWGFINWVFENLP